MKILRSSIAVISASFLALGALALGATAASAAYEENRPGAQSPLQAGNAFWKLSIPSTKHAQPFIQPEDGRLASVSIQVANIEDSYQLASVSIHEFELGVGPSAEPISGGAGIVFGYVETGTSLYDYEILEAQISFPDRPQLEVNKHYAFVIDPMHADNNNGPSASLPIFMSWQEVNPDFWPYVFKDGEWSAHTNGAYVIFTTQLVTLFAETESPALVVSDECGVAATVELPTSEGIIYSEEVNGNTVTVTAAVAEGYELAPYSITSWEFDITAEECVIEEPGEEEPGEEEPGTEEPGTEEPATEEPGETAPDLKVPSPTAPVKEASKELAATGSNNTMFALMGVLIALAGAATFALGRRNVKA